MAWDQLSINKPHLVYILLGAFTSLFMLCSSVIKERLYIGEATVATLFGIIFGPHAAGLIDPGTWGNTDQITEEFSRIVLVVQCFAVGVELPKAYMERHWRSVLALLVPVMTFGYLITSLFIWGLFRDHLNWLDSLAIAACVTATDPVLASSVVGKGKFAKRVPKHLRDLLSAESGCNDGMAFPFIYLALYIIRYQHHPPEVALHWICVTILYECIFGAVYGVVVGYIARRAIRYAHEHDLIDRESFLVFYFVLALFCAGSGSILGIDDLLVGFACGVGFSNDGWFTSETEESHVSNVIDLLLNLSFFVYFGTIIPWEQFNNGYLGMDVWKLVVLGILVLLFRRIPIMIALKPIIPDIKTWREALFAGHFGPIGVGAIFVAILARAELETGETTPLQELPAEGTPFRNTIYLVWPIVCFLVICSIVVHGSSIAVFTLGKHINTLSLTMSYTQASESQHWTDRLPRIQSRSRSSMSVARSDTSFDEKPGQLPFGPPGTFLRRQREEDYPSHAQSRASSRHRSRRSRAWDNHGPGGPITESAFGPRRRADSPEARSDSDTLAVKSDPPSDERIHEQERGREHDRKAEGEGHRDTDGQDLGSPGEIYEEGHHTVYEDEEGNVLAVEPSPHCGGPEREEVEKREGQRLMRREHPHISNVDKSSKADREKENDETPTESESPQEKEGLAEMETEKTSSPPERPGRNWRSGLNKMSSITAFSRRGDGSNAEKSSQAKKEKKEVRGPARAYQYGNTIIVEDEDGEVIKKYDIPVPEKNKDSHADPEKSRHRIGQMSKMLGLGGGHGDKSGDAGTAPESSSAESAAAAGKKKDESHKNAGADGDDNDDDDDARLRFTITTGGRRMSKAEFIDKIRTMDPKSRVDTVEKSDAPESVKREARKDFRDHARASANKSSSDHIPVVREHPSGERERASIGQEHDLKLVESDDGEGRQHQEIPFHDVSSDLRNFRLRSSDSNNAGETAAERRRRLAVQQNNSLEEDSEDDGTERIPPSARARASGGNKHSSHQREASASGEAGETAAERRRREGALGHSKDDSDSEEDDTPRRPPPAATGASGRTNIRFVDQAPPGSAGSQHPRPSALRWGKNVGR